MKWFVRPASPGSKEPGSGRALFVFWLALSGAAAGHPSGWVSREAWGSRPHPIDSSMRHRPLRVNLHHSGVVWKTGDDPLVKIVNLQRWGQREKAWPDLPYHFLVAPDGRIFEGRELQFQPESNTDYPLRGVINVQLWGDFQVQPLPLAQLRATVELLRWLREEHGLTELTTHQQEAPGQTTCPGAEVQRLFDDGSWLRWRN